MQAPKTSFRWFDRNTGTRTHIMRYDKCSKFKNTQKIQGTSRQLMEKKANEAMKDETLRNDKQGSDEIAVDKASVRSPCNLRVFVFFCRFFLNCDFRQFHILLTH